jgi:hypothetical protein
MVTCMINLLFLLLAGMRHILLRRKISVNMEMLEKYGLEKTVL